MTSTKKRLIKSTTQMYTGVMLLKVGKEMKRRKKQQQTQQPVQINESIPEAGAYEYGIYESTIVRVMGSLSSFIEAVLKNDVEIDPFVMKDAQELLNDFQELMDMKKKYEESAQQWN